MNNSGKVVSLEDLLTQLPNVLQALSFTPQNSDDEKSSSANRALEGRRFVKCSTLAHAYDYSCRQMHRKLIRAGKAIRRMESGEGHTLYCVEDAIKYFEPDNQ